MEAFRKWKITSIPKYFLHGISFSIIMLFLGIAWTFIFIVFVAIGSFIGLALGLIILFLLGGGLNALLTDKIWFVPVRTDWKSLLVHGFGLLAFLFIAHLPVILNTSFPNSNDLGNTIFLIIIYSFIDGFIAKAVAKAFEEVPSEE